LRASANAQPAWLWHGYLAGGSVTLLTSQWKSGKTTLVTVLLDRMKTGGTLAGLPVAPGRVVVVTEESAGQWSHRLRRFDFGDHVCWLCRPFRGKPTPQEWQGLVDYLVEMRRRHGIALVVIDPLAAFLPGRDENAAGAMLQTLLSLQRLTALGVAVLILHHPRKRESADGRAARGSGALPAYVDVLLEMHWYSPASPDDRRRRLRAWSRYDETPRQLVIELNAAGTDYLSHGDLAEEEFTRSWAALRAALEGAMNKQTREAILDCWPEEDRPSPPTLWRWLERAVAQGLLCREGTGRKNDPYRYWLPGQEEKWRQDPIASLLLQQDEYLRALRAKAVDTPPAPAEDGGD
jgi:hypothetical protein